MAEYNRQIKDSLGNLIYPVTRVSAVTDFDTEAHIVNRNQSAGVVTLPSLTDLGSGVITVGSFTARVFETSNFNGDLRLYNIAGNTFTLADLTVSYVVVDYNAGTPIVKVVTNVDLITESDVVPVFTVYRHGTHVHSLPWDHLGLGLSNKINQRLVKTQRFTRESGLAVSESAGRIVLVGSGVVWYGAVRVLLDACNSSIDELHLYYHVASAWISDSVHVAAYNNTQYDNGVGLQTAVNNRYLINWIYRGVETEPHLYTVLGTQDYIKLEDAVAAQPRADLPTEIRAHAMLVGKIIVLKNAATATSILSPFDITFNAPSGGGVTDHNSLTGLQGGAVGEYYHLLAADVSKLAGIQAGAEVNVNADWNAVSGDAQILNKPTTLGGYGITDAQPLDADLTAIAALGVTTGFLKKTGANAWAIDTSTYSLTTHDHAAIYQPLDGDLTAIAALAGLTGFLKKTAANTWTLDTSAYSLTSHDHNGTYAPIAHVGAGGTAHAQVTPSVDGFMIAADKTKLNGIEAGAEVNNISDANAALLTGGGNTTLHTHDGRYYTEAEVDALVLAKSYPVGSIYWRNDSTSPATLFGGTWERILDLFPMAGGTTYAPGSTGGAATHVHSSPSHSHTVPSHVHASAAHDHTVPSHVHSSPVHAHGGTGLFVHANIATDGRLYMAKATYSWTGNPSTRITGTAYGTVNGDANTTGIIVGGSTANNAAANTGGAALTTDSTTPGNTGGAALTTDATTPGNTGSTSNLPPYKAFYVWVRTA